MLTVIANMTYTILYILLGGAAMEKEWRRSMPLLSMNIVMQLTGLTARQIRYYEEHELIQPARTEGNQRMFSLDDIDTIIRN